MTKDEDPLARSASRGAPLEERAAGVKGGLLQADSPPMQENREPFGTRARRQLLVLALGAVMAAASAYLAYQGLMAAMRVVVGAP